MRHLLIVTGILASVFFPNPATGSEPKLSRDVGPVVRVVALAEAKQKPSVPRVIAPDVHQGQSYCGNDKIRKIWNSICKTSSDGNGVCSSPSALYQSWCSYFVIQGPGYTSSTCDTCDYEIWLDGGGGGGGGGGTGCYYTGGYCPPSCMTGCSQLY